MGRMEVIDCLKARETTMTSHMKEKYSSSPVMNLAEVLGVERSRFASGMILFIFSTEISMSRCDNWQKVAGDVDEELATGRYGMLLAVLTREFCAA